MSIRYGIGLSLEPGFTSRAYRARQLICGQYASWAAEMNMVYLPVSRVFQCPDSAAAELDSGLLCLAARSRELKPQFNLNHLGVGSSHDATGHIFLDFTTLGSHQALGPLKDSVARLLETTVEVAPDSGEETQAHLPLMQYAKLPAAVFGDVVEFARAVVADLQLPPNTEAWRLLLLRFESGAAGDDWAGGSWAADLRWDLLGSHSL